MTKTAKRYFLCPDDSGTWYIVPCDRRSDFQDWLDQDWRNELADFQAPSYAREVNGDLALVTFSNPVDES